MEGKVVLSARMQAVADMVTPGNRVADVGCDHGYIPIYLVQQGRSGQVIAMDVNKGPLKRAEEHVGEAGLLAYITLRLSDGLLEFRQGEADTLICAGMGGRLIQRILLQEPDKTASFKELILQPQSEIKEFRYFITDMGYSIVSEDMIWEEGKFYPVIKAVKGKEKEVLSQEEARFGPVLLATRHPVLKKYLAVQWQKLCRLEEKLLMALPLALPLALSWEESKAVPLEESRAAAPKAGSSRLEKRRMELQTELEHIKKAAKSMGVELQGE